jgi:uncharacterized protein
LDSVGRIKEIWRYPVSSLGGERLTKADLTGSGLAGDRQYALIDLASGLPAVPEKDRRWRKALHLTAKSTAGKFPAIYFPEDRCHALNDPLLNEALSDYFGFHTGVATYDPGESQFNFPLTQYRHHLAPVHLLTTSSLDQLAKLLQVETVDSRRFRPTALIELSQDSGFAENKWTGRRLQLGATELIVREETTRCGMILISQPGLDEDPEILRTILRHNKRNLGTYCSVERTGTIQVGDELFI